MILLSFDLEEFDLPLETGQTIPFSQQMSVSLEGTRKIVSLLRKYDVRATFFCTATFAINAPQVIQKLVADGHEIASHGYEHSCFDVADLERSKRVLEELSGQSIFGFRMARMMQVENDAVEKAGYIYNSSLNPTFIPGRYNHLRASRIPFREGNHWQLPVSVTPLFRVPLFWLSLHNFPLNVYRRMALRTLRHDGYLNVYFHPWEFVDLKTLKEFRFSGIITRQSGDSLVKRLDSLIAVFKERGYAFCTLSEFVRTLD